MKVSPKTTLIKLIARELRYLPLAELIGRKLTIKSTDTIATDIHQALNDVLPTECNLLTTAKSIKLMLAKYGYLDLTFSAPPELLNHQAKSGMPLLKSLELVSEPTAATVTNEQLEAIFTGYLSDIVEDILQQLAFVRIFLLTDPPQVNKDGWTGSFSLDCLPQLFVIKDACVANSEHVWLNKHCY